MKKKITTDITNLKHVPKYSFDANFCHILINPLLRATYLFKSNLILN